MIRSLRCARLAGMLAAAALAAVVAPQAQANLLVNPGFDGPEVTMLGDVIRDPITADAAGQWLLGGNDNTDRWEIVGGAVAANQPGAEGQGMLQWVQDNKATTGEAILNFDFRMQTPASGDYDLLLYVFAWNTGDTAPGVDYENGTVETGDSFTPRGSVNLITDVVEDIEGMLLLVRDGVPQFPGVVNDGVFHPVSVNVSFGLGHDYVGVLFYAENGGSGGVLEIDNVDFSQELIPEPATIALLALGGLGLLAKRRKRRGQAPHQ